MPRLDRDAVLAIAAIITAVPLTIADLSATPPPSSLESGLLSTIPVTITAPDADGAFRWEAESAGLLTALVEVGLSDLRGVVPWVEGRPVSPGLALAAPSGTPWTAALDLSGSPDALTVSMTLCSPDAACVEHRVVGSRDRLEPAAAALLLSASEQLSRGPVGPIRRGALSGDDYAVLMTGRSAATGYGLLADSENPGDVRRDPVARAPFLDPGVALAWREAGRQAADAADALLAYRRARQLEATSAILLADEAAALADAGECEAAWSRWQAVEERAPLEARFALPQAAAARCAGDLEAAGDILAWMTDDPRPEVAALRVALAEDLGPGNDFDTLLADWQARDPHNPAPVRRRIQLRIDQGAFSEALGMTPLLAERGAADEAEAMRLALLVNLGALQEAESLARSSGQAALVDEIRARQDAPVVSEDPLVSLATAEGLLVNGKPRDALALAEAVLAETPWMPEALALKADAYAAMGKGDAADAARRQLYRADPAHPGGLR